MATCGIFIGLFAITVIPPVSTFDAPAHYFRSELISRGHFRSIRWSERQLGGDVPVRHSRFVDTLWGSYWPSHNFLTLSQWSAIAHRQPGDDLRKHEELTNIAVYSPANYVPQGVAMALSRAADGSPLWAHRAACSLNLLLYLILIVFALETLPRFRGGLLLIATSPFLLIQAATLSIDGLNFAVPLCLYALVWKMRTQPEGDHRWSIAVATCFALWIALLKPTQIVCLVILLFTPISRLGSRRNKVVWLIFTFVVAACLWLYWNLPYLDVNIAGWFDGEHPPISAQRAWLEEHPADFLNALGTFFRRDFFGEWKEFYGGVGGWIDGRVFSELSRLSYLFAVILAIETCRDTRSDRQWGLICLATATALLLLMAITLWLSYGVRNTDYIPYFGGRYLFLVFTLLVISWSELAGIRLGRAGRWSMWVGLALNGVGLGLILIPTANRVAG